MGIIEKLGSRRRVLAVLRTVLSEPVLRTLAEQYHIEVPGFRPSEAPLGLRVRGLVVAAETSRALRDDLDRRLERVASAVGRTLTAMSERDARQELGRVAAHGRQRAVGLLLAGLVDERAGVSRAATQTLEALDEGRIRLVERPRSPRPPRSASPEGRPPRPARGDARFASPRTLAPPRRSPGALERQLAEREEQLRGLRDEATRQEQRLQRLREQLESERAAHERTKLSLESARIAAPGQAASLVESVPAADAAAAIDRLRALQVTTKGQLDAALRDCGFLLRGTQALEEMVETLLARLPEETRESVRPQRPTRISSLPIERKLQLPAEGDSWPRHLQAFLERVAASEFVMSIQPLDFSRARVTRIALEIPDSTILAQYSDGDRAARFLVLTSATSPASLRWVRRHLAEAYFPAA